MKHALITGGAGFIGRHLAEILIEDGCKVRVVDPASTERPVKGAECLDTSILNAPALHDAFEGIDECYHLAAYPHLWAKDARVYPDVNVQGTRNVLKSAEACGIKSVVVSLTEAILIPRIKQYSDPICDEAIGSGRELMPGAYTRSKLEAESLAMDAARKGLDVKLVYPSVPFGAGDHHMTPPAAMLERFLQGKNPAFLECILNVVSVEDVARGHMLASRKGERGKRYFLGGGNMRLSEILRVVEERSGVAMPKKKVPGWLALCMAYFYESAALLFPEYQPPASIEGVRLALASAPLDNRETCEALAWQPEAPEEAIKAAVNWLMRRV